MHTGPAALLNRAGRQLYGRQLCGRQLYGRQLYGYMLMLFHSVRFCLGTRAAHAGPSRRGTSVRSAPAPVWLKGKGAMQLQ